MSLSPTANVSIFEYDIHIWTKIFNLVKLRLRFEKIKATVASFPVIFPVGGLKLKIKAKSYNDNPFYEIIHLKSVNQMYQICVNYLNE